MLFDLGPAFTPPIRGTANKRFQARAYWLTDGNELVFTDSAVMTLLTARKWSCRVRRSDVLEIEWYAAGELPTPPEGIRRIDRIPTVVLVETWRDTLF